MFLRVLLLFLIHFADCFAKLLLFKQAFEWTTFTCSKAFLYCIIIFTTELYESAGYIIPKTHTAES